RFAQVHIVAALAEHARALHTGRPRTDGQDRARRSGLGELLRMPAAAVFLVCGGVLRADDGRAADLPTGDADVAADALANVLVATFLDLLGNERVRDRRTGEAEDIEAAFANARGHVVRTGFAADAQHGHLGNALAIVGPVALVPCL